MSGPEDSEYLEFSMEIKQIIQKHTSWETTEDLDKVDVMYCSWASDTKFDIKDLETELERIKELHSDLQDYDRDCQKSLHDVVEIAKHQIFDKFPGIQNKEAYNQLDEEYWIEVILKDRTVNDTVYHCECSRVRPKFSLTTLAYGRSPYRSCTSCCPPVVETDESVEIRLKELYEELGSSRSKVLEEYHLCMNSSAACYRVGNLKRGLEGAANVCRLNLKDEIINVDQYKNLASFPMEIKEIIQKYTSWETMEDLDNASAEYCSSTSRFDIHDLEIELERMEKLRSDLEKYDRDHCKKSLHDVIEISKHQIVDKFPCIQNIELFTGGSDEDWVCVILEELANDTVFTVGYGRDTYSILPSLVETDLTELCEELGTNRNKVLEAHELCMTSLTVCQSVDRLIKSLKFIVDQCRREKEKEKARKLAEEKLQCLCNLMKEVLGDRVENVVVSSKCVSPCFLRVSGLGGKTMEINPHDRIIKDLCKRSDANKNDMHVRDATLLLFNYAELYLQSSV